MSKQQKQIAMIAGGAILLYLIYRYYQGQQASSSTTGAVAPDTSGADFASLAGQEQSDAAALQGQNTQLASQEQSDVAGLTGQIGGLGAQENADITALTGQVGNLASTVDTVSGTQTSLQSEIASIALGEQAINRAQTATTTTHQGGPFYKYYVAVTGHAPPRTVPVTNFIYQAWQAGIKATALASPKPAPAKPHPSSKNTQVAHPNGNHAQQPAIKPATTHKPTPTRNPQPAASGKTTAPTKPKPKTKPKASAPRK